MTVKCIVKGTHVLRFVDSDDSVSQTQSYCLLSQSFLSLSDTVGRCPLQTISKTQTTQSLGHSRALSSPKIFQTHTTQSLGHSRTLSSLNHFLDSDHSVSRTQSYCLLSQSFLRLSPSDTAVLSPPSIISQTQTTQSLRYSHTVSSLTIISLTQMTQSLKHRRTLSSHNRSQAQTTQSLGHSRTFASHTHTHTHFSDSDHSVSQTQSYCLLSHNHFSDSDDSSLKHSRTLSSHNHFSDSDHSVSRIQSYCLLSQPFLRLTPRSLSDNVVLCPLRIISKTHITD